MRINKILDEIFARKSNIAVIRTLKNFNTGISGREVSRNIGLAANNTLKTLTYLEDLGIVSRIRGGREHLFTLKRNNYIVDKAILPLLKVEEDFTADIKLKIKSALQKKVEAAIIFGSVARKEETELSDLDLCIITEDSDKIAEASDKLRKQMYEIFNVNISFLYISKKNFINKAKKNQPPIADIIKEGEIIVGQSIRRILNG